MIAAGYSFHALSLGLPRRNFVSHFGMQKETVKRWLSFVEDQYIDSNPYHSSTHAADVTQAVHWMLGTGGAKEFLTDFECLGILLSGN